VLTKEQLNRYSADLISVLRNHMAVRAYNAPTYRNFFHLEQRVIDVTALTFNWCLSSGAISFFRSIHSSSCERGKLPQGPSCSLILRSGVHCLKENIFHSMILDKIDCCLPVSYVRSFYENTKVHYSVHLSQPPIVLLIRRIQRTSPRTV
jgi:hypothetical protein